MSVGNFFFRINFRFKFTDAGCDTSEHVPLRSAICAVVQTSVGVTEISLASNTSNQTNASVQVAQL